MEITLEEIQKKFESLPEDLKWAIMAANVDDNIIEISQTNGLNVEQMGQLSLETHMVMFGFTPLDKFEESIRNSLKLGDEKTRRLVTAINEKILKEIRGKMVESFGAEKKPEGSIKINTVDSSVPKKVTITSETEEENKKNTQVLNDAGIEIVPEKLELPTTKETPSIITQKLSGFMQNTVVKTEHTIDNMTKSTPTSYPPKADPYRINPE